MSLVAIAVFAAMLLPGLPAQTPPRGNVCGVVQDQTGAMVGGAGLELQAGDARFHATTDDAGRFCFHDLVPGAYRLLVQARGFRDYRQAVLVRSNSAARLTIVLRLATVGQQITVAAGAADLDSLSVAQTQLGRGLIRNLPSESVNAALSSILTLATPGVAAAPNGIFHPLGEHAESSFSVDGQPISDQQSRIFSNQISASTIQSMQTLQGAPPAEYGDKTSLIILVTTRSGLGAGKFHGTVSLGYGSFSTPTTSITLASGSRTWGNFLALDGINSHRFLDTPEFQPLHARGNAEDGFDRWDWRPNDVTSFHLSVSGAHSWFQVPNTYDQQKAGQDQLQHMTSMNADLAYSHVFGPALLLTANAWARQDRVNYYTSPDLFSDQPATLSQARRLTSLGLSSDLTYSHGRHAVKGGIQLQVWPLSEGFETGLTDPGFNSPCVDAEGVTVPDPSLASPVECAASGYAENPSFQPALLPYDLTRGGVLFQFRGAATIREESAYLEDSIQLDRFHLNLGLRYDNYDGLSRGSGVQPRAGIAYQLRSTGTVLNFSYARIFLTPYNENLVLSSETGPGGLATNGSLGAEGVEPLTPARRNQYNVGFEQQIGAKFNLQAEYFWKYTGGAYDFNSILNTPLNFPIQFRLSKIDGAMVRATLTNERGFSAFAVLGHVRSRLFSPEIGGIDFGGMAYAPVARPDHDQGFELTTNLQYQFPHLLGFWLGLTWRFDSGLVVVSVPDYAAALTLTGDDQQAIGLYCSDALATVEQPLRTCASSRYGATRIHIVAPGTYNPDTNPSRVSPRNLFDVAAGSDGIWNKDNYSLGMKVSVINLMDKVALYNFLSSFAGTHFVAPRTVQAELTLRF